jgi:hypothetical protein
MISYPLVWHWTSILPERKGQRCRILVYSRALNSVLVEFEPDRHRVVTSRFAVRASKDAAS